MDYYLVQNIIILLSLFSPREAVLKVKNKIPIGDDELLHGTVVFSMDLWLEDLGFEHQQHVSLPLMWATEFKQIVLHSLSDLIGLMLLFQGVSLQFKILINGI